MHVEGEVGWIQQHMLVCLIVREDRVVISEFKGIKWSKLLDQVTGILHLFFTFQDIMKLILHFAISFEKEYNEEFIASRIVDIVKAKTYRDLLTEISIQYY